MVVMPLNQTVTYKSEPARVVMLLPGEWALLRLSSGHSVRVPWSELDAG